MNSTIRLWVVMLSLATGCLPGHPPKVASIPTSANNPGAMISRASLREDLRQLAKLLDESHPDPYSSGGGRVAFYRLMHEIDISIPEQGTTLQGFLRLVRPLVSSVRDGHTTIRAPQMDSAPRTRLWLDFDAASGHLFISGVYSAQYRAALGARVVAVDGISFADLVQRQKKMRGYDNDYNNLAHLIATLTDGQDIADILDLPHPPDQVRVQVELPGSTNKVVVATLSTRAPGEVIIPDSSARNPLANAADLGWGFLDNKHAVAFVRIDSAMRYREAFEVWKTNGYSRNLEAHLLEVATAATGGKPPDTIDARIASIPSATDTFGELFAAMRRDGTSTLIVDLRKNGNTTAATSLSDSTQSRSWVQPSMVSGFAASSIRLYSPRSIARWGTVLALFVCRAPAARMQSLRFTPLGWASGS